MICLICYELFGSVAKKQKQPFNLFVYISKAMTRTKTWENESFTASWE